MDFMNRGGRPVQQNTPTPGPVETPKGPGKRPNFKDTAKASRVAFVAFVAVIAVLLVLLIAAMFTSKGSDTNEASNVNKDQYQAVFLNGGQVYFGKINELNSKYLGMNNIYYLRVNQQVQPDQQQQNAAQNDISLVKLGCELHGPEDKMIINREQIIFWENLKTDGQVAKAVEEYVKANPNGQKCDQQQGTNTENGTPNNSANTGNTNNTGTNQNR